MIMNSLFSDSGLHIENKRRPGFDIDPIFINRWSPRAYDSTPINDNIIKSIFEAARWTMSCFNEQPWLFLYATDEKELGLFRGVLAEFNQKWASNAPVLGFIFAKRRFARNDKPNDWAAFDCGAAWMALTMQARMLGLYTHGMAGFDREKVYDVLNISKNDYEALCAFTVGRYGDRNKLPDDMKKDEQPNDRSPLKDILIKGKYK